MSFLKANFGLSILVVIFFVLVGLAVHMLHSQVAGAGDFIAWNEGKAGEVLASIMTMIVGATAASRRSGDSTTTTTTTSGLTDGSGGGSGKFTTTTSPIPSTPQSTGHP